MNWYSLLKLSMPPPSPDQASKVYYHGTSNEKAGQAILANGYLRPRAETGMQEGKGMLAPVIGKVYMSPSLAYGMIYAIGGSMAGHDLPKSFLQKDGQYGYLFQIEGSLLKDIQPDEDSVGEMVHNQKLPWLNSMAQRIVAPSRYKKCMDGWYAFYASIGKQLLKQMNDFQKKQIIDAGAHVAHQGAIKPSAAWRFDKLLCKLLVEDGSNFFQLAEKVL